MVFFFFLLFIFLRFELRKKVSQVSQWDSTLFTIWELIGRRWDRWWEVSFWGNVFPVLGGAAVRASVEGFRKRKVAAEGG